MKSICRRVFLMSLKISNGIAKNHVPGRNGCVINESFGAKGKTGAAFCMILGVYGYINLPSTEKAIQICKRCL